MSHKVCSTPEGITTTRTVVRVLCSARRCRDQRQKASRRPEPGLLVGLYGDRITCSTPEGITTTRTIEAIKVGFHPTPYEVKARRHHDDQDGTYPGFGGNATACSTPEGITTTRTNSRNARASAGRSSAQRQKASRRQGRLVRAAVTDSNVGPLNARRHHDDEDQQWAVACIAAAKCSTPEGITTTET